MSAITSSKKEFIKCFLFVLIMGIPWIVAYAPGTLEPDAYRQLMEGTGAMGLTSHHPVLVTQGMSKIFAIVRKFGGGGAII